MVGWGTKDFPIMGSQYNMKKTIGRLSWMLENNLHLKVSQVFFDCIIKLVDCFSTQTNLESFNKILFLPSWHNNNNKNKHFSFAFLEFHTSNGKKFINITTKHVRPCKLVYWSNSVWVKGFNMFTLATNSCKHALANTNSSMVNSW